MRATRSDSPLTALSPSDSSQVRASDSAKPSPSSNGGNAVSFGGNSRQSEHTAAAAKLPPVVVSHRLFFRTPESERGRPPPSAGPLRVAFEGEESDSPASSGRQRSSATSQLLRSPSSLINRMRGISSSTTTATNSATSRKSSRHRLGQAGSPRCAHTGSQHTALADPQLPRVLDRSSRCHSASRRVFHASMAAIPEALRGAGRAVVIPESEDDPTTSVKAAAAPAASMSAVTARRGRWEHITGEATGSGSSPSLQSPRLPFLRGGRELGSGSKRPAHSRLDLNTKSDASGGGPQAIPESERGRPVRNTAGFATAATATTSDNAGRASMPVTFSIQKRASLDVEQQLRCVSGRHQPTIPPPALRGPSGPLPGRWTPRALLVSGPGRSLHSRGRPWRPSTHGSMRSQSPSGARPLETRDFTEASTIRSQGASKPARRRGCRPDQHVRVRCYRSVFLPCFVSVRSRVPRETALPLQFAPSHVGPIKPIFSSSVVY